MRINNTTQLVLDDILGERRHQWRKFGDDNRIERDTDGIAGTVLGEEYGEACKEINDTAHDGIPRENALYNELVQVAAVACAIAEKVRLRNDHEGIYLDR